MPIVAIGDGSIIASSSSTDLALPPFWPIGLTSGSVITASTTSINLFYSGIVVQPNVVYTASAYVFSSNFISTNVQVSAGPSFVTDPPIPNGVAGVWLRPWVSLAIPPDIPVATFQITITGTTPGDLYYVTGALFDQSTSLDAYFDGSYRGSDYFWEGDPNSSISDYYPNLINKRARLQAVLQDFLPISRTYSIVIGAPAYENAGVVG